MAITAKEIVRRFLRIPGSASLGVYTSGELIDNTPNIEEEGGHGADRDYTINAKERLCFTCPLKDCVMYSKKCPHREYEKINNVKQERW